MKVSFFLGRRIAFNKSSSFSKFIIRIAIIATAISVAVMILSTALINGFQQTIQDKIFSFWGHIHINKYQPNAGPLTEQAPFAADPKLVKSILATPGVKSINEFATKSVIVKTPTEIEGLIYKGLDKNFHLNNWQRFIIEGKFIQFNDSTYSSDVLISQYLANRLQLKLNDKVIVYFIQGAGQAPRARKLNISGIYKTGIEEYDKTYMVGDINLVRRLNDWHEDDIGGYEIFINNYKQIDTIAYSLIDDIPEDLGIRRMQDIYPNIFDWLDLQHKNEIIILVIMAIVAVINMITAILILILERTNMIGILKALGMRNRSIQTIFLYQAGYIVLLGIVIGNLLGLGLAFLQLQTGFFKLPEETYYMSVAPIDIEWWKVIAINVGTLLVCMLIISIPALIIRRIVPVKAIQFK
ncbi:lipoprotein-releasing system permease protein [Chitinophaga skermanii]|uniref:Lipoprotein-releasing system permease protein n=1 Tax=Chitinophaga skermanii TaxID=331697 RepID=A0A327Q7M7_9BACT|nr:FtsX-like permease family protein [Chitinophaga skermanii]RAI99731.1 lipoprotein-releasing system permease protein [Chitinophaga skermanii]